MLKISDTYTPPHSSAACNYDTARAARRTIQDTSCARMGLLRTLSFFFFCYRYYCRTDGPSGVTLSHGRVTAGGGSHLSFFSILVLSVPFAFYGHAGWAPSLTDAAGTRYDVRAATLSRRASSFSGTAVRRPRIPSLVARSQGDAQTMTAIR